MTIHAPRSAAYAWHCEHARCHAVGAGYPSQSAAAKAETHHTEQAHNAGKPVTR